jgi:hypothetical protein
LQILQSGRGAPLLLLLGSAAFMQEFEEFKKEKIEGE